MWLISCSTRKKCVRRRPRHRRLVAGLLLLSMLIIACSIATGARTSTSSGTIGRSNVVDKSNVIVVTRENLAMVKKGKWFIDFYDPRCIACVKLQSAWEDVAQELAGKVKVGKVNCNVEKVLCEQFDVMNYPTLIHLDNQRARKYEATKSRSRSALVAFALEGYQTAPTYPTLRTPFGPVQSAKALFRGMLFDTRDSFLEQMEQGTPVWVMGSTVVLVLATVTTAVAWLLVVTSRPKQD